MTKPRNPRPGPGWHLMEPGTLKQQGDEVMEVRNRWVPIHPSERGKELRENEPPHRCAHPPLSGDPEQVYLDNPPGDDPATAFNEIDRRDCAERLFEAVSVGLISEFVSERRQVIRSAPDPTGGLIQLGLTLAEDLEIALQAAENAAEIAYPTPAPKGAELPEVAV